MNIDDALKQAVHCHQTGQLQKAEMLYRGILQTHPMQPDANHNLGLLSMHAGQPSSSLRHLRNAWGADPNNELFCLTLTECLLMTGRSDDA